MTHCDIIIPVWNQLECTQKCMESLVKNTDYPYKLIVIDNASDELTSNYLDVFSKDHADIVQLIRNEKNIGYVKATNQGMKASTGSYLCLLNNDTEVYAGWLSELVSVAELDNEIGLVNPASNHFNIRYEDCLEEQQFRYAGMGRIVGFCLLVKREVMDEIGCLDERFGMGYGDDDAYCMSAQKAGYRCVLAKKSYVYHDGKKSFGRNKKAKLYREKQRELSKKLLGVQPKVEFFLFSKDLSSLAPILELMRGLADKAIKSKVFLRVPLTPVPYEHFFVDFRILRNSLVYTISFIYRFLFDRRYRIIATDNSFIFNVAKYFSPIVDKQLFLFKDKVYDAQGQIYSYTGKGQTFITALKERVTG